MIKDSVDICGSTAKILYPHFRDGMYSSGFALRVLEDDATSDVLRRLDRENEQRRVVLQRFGLIEVRVCNEIAHNLIEMCSPGTPWNPSPSSVFDCTWHQDGRTNDCDNAGYRIGRCWPHTKQARTSAQGTQLVPISAYVSGQCTFWHSPEISQYLEYEYSTKRIHEIQEAFASLHRQVERANTESKIHTVNRRYREACQQLLKVTSYQEQWELTEMGITAKVFSPIHNVRWDTPAILWFQNSGVYHRRNGPSTVYEKGLPFFRRNDVTE